MFKKKRNTLDDTTTNVMTLVSQPSFYAFLLAAESNLSILAYWLDT